MEANSCKGRHMGSSEACMSSVWAGEGILWRAGWQDFQWYLDLGIPQGGSVRILGEDFCPKGLESSASCPVPPNRGIRLGSHRGQRKSEDVVEPLG